MEIIVLNNLKDRLKDYKISYRKLSKTIGIAPKSLNDKINGTRYFNTKEIMFIVDILEIPINEIGLYFFTGEPLKSVDNR